MRRGAAIAGLAAGMAALLLAPGCAGRALAVREAPPGAARVGVYKGRLADETRSRRFRLLLYARLPDRLHAEVVSPLGRTELIVDGGDGRLAVAVVDERLAFVGPATAEAMQRIVGVAVPPGQLVRALLRGEPGPADYELRRTGPPGPALPEAFEIRRGGRALELQLRRTAALPTSEAALGTGAAPAGFERRPLQELAWDWFHGADDDDDVMSVDTPIK